MTSWRDDAACLGSDVSLFVTSGGRGVAPVEAMRTCVTCPVRRPCLDYALALSTGEDSGVFGGTTRRDRDSIRGGSKTAEQAMARGDVIARRRTDAEIAAEERASRSKSARRRLGRR